MSETGKTRPSPGRMDAPGFATSSALAGLRAGGPLLVALLPFALVVGVLAQGHGLSLAETTLMSAAVYAGSAQLLALGHWGVPAPLVGALLATVVVNLRLALMGPVVTPWLGRVRGWRLWLTLFLMADQNWALSVTEMRAGRWDAGFLFGCGVLMWVAWVAGTAVGYLLGAQLALPPGHPLFFAALAAFVALCAGLWRGRADLLPWVAAGGTSLLCSRLLPGTLYIVAGAVAGALAGVLQERRR